MTTKYILNAVLLSAVLVQICNAKPKPESETFKISLQKNNDLCLQKTKYDDMEPSEKDNFSNQLLKFTLKGFQELALQYVKKGKNISEKLLTNNEILTSRSAKISAFKHNLTQFEEKYALCNGLEELFELVEVYSNTTSYYFELKESSLDADDKLILSLLRKYGSEDLDEETLNTFDEFVLKFEKKFEDLRSDINKAESKVSKNMLEWFARFKTLTEFEQKFLAFEEFFALLEEE